MQDIFHHVEVKHTDSPRAKAFLHFSVSNYISHLNKTKQCPGVRNVLQCFISAYLLSSGRAKIFKGKRKKNKTNESTRETKAGLKHHSKGQVVHYRSFTLVKAVNWPQERQAVNVVSIRGAVFSDNWTSNKITPFEIKRYWRLQNFLFMMIQSSHGAWF